MRTRFVKPLGFGIIVTMLLVGCAERAPTPPPRPTPSLPSPTPELRTQRPYQIKGVWYYPIPSAQSYVEEGMASWYGADFHGKPTSCGEPYDMNAMTAAHKTLPLGTYVKVTNLDNGCSVILRVNDRGPFVAGRIIDLSRRAAQELGSARPGLARVKVEAVQHASEQQVGQNTLWKVDPIPSFRYGLFTIQIGSFREPGNAARLKAKMTSGNRDVQICPFDYQGCSFYRVQVGFYRDILLAQQELKRLRFQGFGDAFVVAMEEK